MHGQGRFMLLVINALAGLYCCFSVCIKTNSWVVYQLPLSQDHHLMETGNARGDHGLPETEHLGNYKTNKTFGTVDKSTGRVRRIGM